MKIVRKTPVNDTGTFTRASDGCFWDNDGVLQIAPPNTPRFTYDLSDRSKPPILLLETGATNFIQNNQMQGAAPGNTRPTSWGSIDWYSLGVTAAISAIGSENGIDYLDVRYQGVAQLEMDMYVRFNNFYNAAAIPGETWSISAFHKIVESAAQLPEMFTYLQEYDMYGGFNSMQTQTLNVSSVLARSAQSRKLDWADTQYLVCGLKFKFASGTPVDFVIRIGLPQLEKGAPSSPIKTSGAPGVRAPDSTNMGFICPIVEDDAPYYSPTIPYAFGDRMIERSNHTVYESGLGTRFTSASVSVAAPGVVTVANHGLSAGASVVFDVGPLPTGLELFKEYFVVNPAVNTFNVSATKGGTGITTTGTARTDVGFVANGNFGQGAPNEDRWIDTGPTNRYALFDDSIESQMTALDQLTFAVKTPAEEFVDTVVIKNVEDVSAVRVAMVTEGGEIVYDKTVSMFDNSGINDPFKYTFEQIEYNTDLILSGIPAYAGSYLSVTMVGVEGLVKAGLFVMGRAKDFGPTQAGMSLGMIDYSKKEKNDYGKTKVVEGSYSETMTLTCFVDRSKMNSLIRYLVSLRATPAVYIGDATLTSSVQYGYFTDYSMGADYPEHSVLHAEIESLT
jgi:hypothetical protein